MKAVILAGGKGVRLKPLTNHLPKPMVPVGPRRCIDYVIRSLSKAGINELIVTTGYLSDRVIKGIADGSAHGVNVVYSFEDEPLGTAGGTRQVASFLGDETFVVASGDVLADVNIRRLVERHEQYREQGAVATLALTRAADPTEYGIVGIAKDGRVERFKEKPRKEQVFSDLINAGIYVIEPEVLDEVPPRQAYDFSKDLWPDLLERGVPLYGEVIEGFWMDVGRPEDLIEANILVIQREGSVAAGDGAKVIQGRRAKLGAGVRLAGAVLIGDFVRVGEECVLRDSAVHDGTTLLRGCRVERSVVLEDCEIGAGACLKDSIVATGAQIGQGAQLEGCVVGEGARIEANAVLRGARVPDH